MKVFDFTKFMNCQCDEIRKYRWIESEKLGYDLGKMAEQDWIAKYAANFRAWAKLCDQFYKDEGEK